MKSKNRTNLKTLFIAFLLIFSQANQAFAETASGAGANNNSLEFASSSTYLSLSPGINVGTSAFTFETYFKNGPVLDNGFFLGVGSGNGISINIHSSNEIQVDAYGINATVFELASPLQVNTWHHLAVSRDASNNETVWLDGVRATRSYNRWNNALIYGPVFTDTRNYNGNATGINISTGCGHCNDGPVPGSADDRDFNGVRITNFRVVVGSSVYDPNSATITLPTTPLANVTNTKLLLNVTDSSSATTDSSGNQTITNTSVVFRTLDATNPSAPTSLSATAGDGQATISFTPGATNGSAITNYQYSLDGSTYTAFSPAQTSSPVTITGLTNWTSYSIYLKAVNGIGASSASSSVSVTPIAPPSGGASNAEITPTVTTTVIGKSELITWNTKSNLNLTIYNKNTKKTKTELLTGGSVEVSRPKPGQTATYTVATLNGEILKNFTLKTKPESPKKVLINLKATTLNASWVKAAGAKKYRVTIVPESGNSITLITTDPNISFDLDNPTKATIKIVAIGANGLTSQVVKKSI